MDSPSKPLSSPIAFTSEVPKGNIARPRTQSQSSQDSESTFTQGSSPLIPPRRLYAQPNTSSASIQSFSRPLQRPVVDPARRAASPTEWVPGHRARQRSQGFFDPTISSASSSAQNMSGLSTSQLAAQAAMHIQNNNHNRKRSQTLPDPSAATPSPAAAQAARRPPAVQAVPYAQPQQNAPVIRGYDSFIGGHSLAAATAANAAFPRSPGQAPPYSPQFAPDRQPPPVPEKDAKSGKEKTKMKLFSKPKNIGIYKDDKKHPALSSPRLGTYNSSNLNKFPNISTTSLVESNISSSSSSFYSAQNTSTSTLVPADRDKEKEKHKHHFLSRQKNKLKDKDDLHLALSSASSTSRPTDPSAPQPLYNFAVPSSPGHGSTFAKSVSGLDLRHGGRALREKKKEEKLTPNISNNSLEQPLRDASLSQSSDWLGTPNYNSNSTFSPLTSGTSVSHVSDLGLTQAGVANLGNSFGISGLQPDDAWPLLKAKLLNIFEGEELRPPIEDFNALVSVHIKRCIQRRAPTLIIEDLNELLQTGFLSLDQTLRQIPDDRLVPHLVAMWNLVFSIILPFLQAVFLPLDLEFKGRGPIMSAREAADFWGAALPSDSDATDPDANRNIFVLGEELDVRRIVLLKFRDTVFLPRHEALMAIFTRLSLESISAGIYPYDPLPEPPPIGSATRPGTAQSADGFGSPYQSMNSYNSQSSTHLDSGSPFSAVGRSRATSNTSAGSFPSSVGAHSAGSQSHAVAPAPQPMDSAQVTEMVGRMLQCVSVLASVQSKDDAQSKMERLTKELKLNWLGRGRTGRQRRGFVGTRLRPAGATFA
ncbi:uncharacterized protein PV09_02657 [Verruconis gallopava]|uniref:HbrB-like protein n=1 Tax=Verruconis gallopava TaxID=253628 RepID=A0A0D1XTS2_9PEZI|nr:uncharacterized protein PV09_02657 [Verruconis gallopava]KIW06171.1 hypothetical protein PV09_02657 [Verruconis gallopava]